jgi:hypothetical protein
VISRRRFLTGAALALAPLGAPAHAQEYKAQQAGRVYRIGILGNVPPTDTEGVYRTRLLRKFPGWWLRSVKPRARG